MFWRVVDDTGLSTLGSSEVRFKNPFLVYRQRSHCRTSLEKHFLFGRRAIVKMPTERGHESGECCDTLTPFSVFFFARINNGIGFLFYCKAGLVGRKSVGVGTRIG